MAKFSERYGYSVSNTIVRGRLIPSIVNSIINYCCLLKEDYSHVYADVIRQVWIFFLNNRVDYLDSHLYRHPDPIVDVFSSDSKLWYEKMDLLEFVHEVFQRKIQEEDLLEYDKFLNSEFERHNYAYRLVSGSIVEVTSEEEIHSIELACENEFGEVKVHMKSAIKFMSSSNQEPDYRNSIKESISAVESFCRVVTKKTTLGEALKALEVNGVSIQPQLKDGLNKIYAYTNNDKTGIRHALIEDGYVPTSDEAMFMLVTCSAFVNYLTRVYTNS